MHAQINTLFVSNERIAKSLNRITAEKSPIIDYRGAQKTS